jgi:hypothetical protein
MAEVCRSTGSAGSLTGTDQWTLPTSARPIPEAQTYGVVRLTMVAGTTS